MIGKTGVPPDAGVNGFRKRIVFLVCAGFLAGAIQVDEAGARNHGIGGFGLAGVHVEGILLQRIARLFVGAVLNVHDVVVGLFKLRLREQRQQAFVAAVAVGADEF